MREVGVGSDYQVRCGQVVQGRYDLQGVEAGVEGYLHVDQHAGGQPLGAESWEENVPGLRRA